MAALQGSTQWALHSSCRVFSCQGCSPGPWHRGHPHRTAGSRGTAIVIMIHLQHSIVFFNPVRATAVHLLPPSHEQPQPDPGLPLSSWEALQLLWLELWDLQAGLLALVFPHHCFRRNPKSYWWSDGNVDRKRLSQPTVQTVTALQMAPGAARTPCSAHCQLLLTSGVCEAGSPAQSFSVQTMVKSLSSGGEIPPNKFFPVVRLFFFFLANIRTISSANTCTSLQRKAWTYP